MAEIETKSRKRAGFSLTGITPLCLRTVLQMANPAMPPAGVPSISLMFDS
ncbi:hypothetical protein [Blastomonas sp.]